MQSERLYITSKKTSYVVFSWGGAGTSQTCGPSGGNTNWEEEEGGSRTARSEVSQEGTCRKPRAVQVGRAQPLHPARVCPLHLPRPRCGSILKETDGLFSCWEEASTKYIKKKKIPLVLKALVPPTRPKDGLVSASLGLLQERQEGVVSPERKGERATLVVPGLLL